jgi:hypothetical protein
VFEKVPTSQSISISTEVGHIDQVRLVDLGKNREKLAKTEKNWQKPGKQVKTVKTNKNQENWQKPAKTGKISKN